MDTLKSMLFYTTTKRLKVRYWQLGAFYYGISLALIYFYGESMLYQGEFLKKVEVTGSVNPFAESFSHPSVSCEATGSCVTQGTGLVNGAYCSAASQKFEYSSDFIYQASSGSSLGPECRLVDVYEINTKTQNYLSFTSVYAESQVYGWPCADSTSAFALEAQAACDTPYYVHPIYTSQCECTIKKAVFPAAVEDYTVHVAHVYNVKELLDNSWEGASSRTLPSSDGSKQPLDTIVAWPDGSVTETRGGDDIQIKLKDLLKMTDPPIDLSAQNMGVFRGAEEGTSTYPTYRHTGVEIVIDMEYTNRKDGDMMLLAPLDKNVDATMTVTAVPGWKSIGPKTFYPVYPTGAVGAQKYHRVIQYPQDVEIKFRTYGHAYAFDYVHLVQTVLDLVVLISVAKSITDFVVFFCIPNVSIVLRNKRDESTSRLLAFKELGMRAAICVNQFHRINNDRPGDLNLADLVKVFGSVEGVSKEQALNIAQTVLGAEKKKITFNDFMSITEGSTIGFEDFLKLSAYTASASGGDDRTLAERNEALAEYDKVEQGIKLDAPPTPPQPPPQAAGGVIAPPQMQIQIQQPQPPAMPPGVVKLQCGQCRQAFGVPSGAKMVKCPFCQSLNNTAAATQSM